MFVQRKHFKKETISSYSVIFRLILFWWILFSNYTVVNLQESGVKAESLLSGSYSDQSPALCYTAFLRWVVLIWVFQIIYLCTCRCLCLQSLPTEAIPKTECYISEFPAWLLKYSPHLGPTILFQGPSAGGLHLSGLCFLFGECCKSLCSV